MIGYICRILANLDQKYPNEIRKHLASKLVEDYEHYKGITTRSVNYLFDNRVRNVYFLIECTKFRLIPPNNLLDILLWAMEKFETIDKHIIIKCLELAGRFLKRYDESKVKFRYILDLLTKKIRSYNGPDYLCRQIDSCIGYCNKERLERNMPVAPKTVIEEYLEFLVYKIDRNRENQELMKEEFFKLPWKQNWQLLADTILRLVLSLRQNQVGIR